MFFRSSLFVLCSFWIIAADLPPSTVDFAGRSVRLSGPAAFELETADIGAFDFELEQPADPQCTHFITIKFADADANECAFYSAITKKMDGEYKRSIGLIKPKVRELTTEQNFSAHVGGGKINGAVDGCGMAETRLTVEMAGSQFCTGVLRFKSGQMEAKQEVETVDEKPADRENKTTPHFFWVSYLSGMWTATVFFTFGVTCGVLGSFCFLFSGAVVVVKDGEKRAARQALEQKAEAPPFVEAPLQPTAHGRKATPEELAALAQFEAERKRTEDAPKTLTESLRVTAVKLKEAARNATAELSSRASQAAAPSAAEPSAALQVKIVQKYV